MAFIPTLAELLGPEYFYFVSLPSGQHIEMGITPLAHVERRLALAKDAGCSFTLLPLNKTCH